MEICPQDKRVSLEIRFDDDGKVSLARCCFLYAFSHLTLEEYAKIDDIIDYSENHQVNYAKSSNICVAKCYLEKKIKQVDVGISHACNMRCMNCFFTEHKDTPEMKKAYFDTLYKIKGHQLDTIMMNNGGEVFIYYDEILEYLNSLTPNDTRQVTFVTNLVLLNEERFKELKKVSEETGVSYFFLPSVDGITKESYEAIRIGGTFEKITENLKLLGDVFGPQNAVILYTIKKPNINETEKVEKYFNDKFGVRVSISFDVYDKECENRYNSIFRKDFSEEAVIVSKKEEPSFKFLTEPEKAKVRLLSIFTDKVPTEETIKKFDNDFVMIYIFSKKTPKWISKYNNVFMVNTSLSNFYIYLNSKVFTKYFMFVEDLSTLEIKLPRILDYFLEHIDSSIIRFNRVSSENKVLNRSDYIIERSFFKDALIKMKATKNPKEDFKNNILELENLSSKTSLIPDEVMTTKVDTTKKGFLNGILFRNR